MEREGGIFLKTTDCIERLLKLIGEATSPYHTVQAAVGDLKEAGFEELCGSGSWPLERGGRYFTVHHGTTLFAFTVGEKFDGEDPLRLAAAHTDFPGFRIKPNPEYAKEGYLQLNTEVYGGASLMTWLDRPLSVAGKVMLKGEDAFHPVSRLVDLKRPLFTIPNLAIHLNKDMNKGVELNKQKHMLPVGGVCGEKEEKEEGRWFIEFLAGEFRVNAEDILDFDLNLYNTDKGTVIGLREEFLSAPRLDNLTSVQALANGLICGKRERGVNLIALFDHEEIGSKTKQGAGSTMLELILERIYLAFGRNRGNLMGALEGGLLLSADVGHAIHPAYADKSDVTNKNVLGGGIAIKEASAQSYATDTEAVAIVQQICMENGIPFQKFSNRSDGTSGGTLGSIASAMLPVRTVDVGVPLLAMHSSRELGGVKDQEALNALLEAYFAI